MSIAELLDYLQTLDVELWIEGGRLRYSAPKGALTPALRASLTERKGEILAFLQAHATDFSPPPLLPVARSSEMPLSFAQQRLWFLAQLEPDNPAYNLTHALQLTGSLDVTALRLSVNALVQRHEALRTTFKSVDGSPIQIIASSLILPLPVSDLSSLPNGLRQAELQRLARQDFQRPFDLAQGPLLRVNLLRLEPHEHALLLNMHHIVSDGWSMGILVSELTTLYQSFLSHNPSPLPDLPVQYADYAVWQRQWLQGESLATQIAYWRQQLAGALSTIDLPTDRPRPPLPTSRGAIYTFTIPQSLLAQLVSLSRSERVTLFMTLLAAFQILLARYSGQRDIVVSSPIAGRNQSHLEGLIGFFVNTLVMRTYLADNPTFRSLLQRVRKTALEAYTHQDLPFEQLIEILQPQRDLSRTPFDQVSFALQNMPIGHLHLAGLDLQPLNIDNSTAKSDLTFFLYMAGEALGGMIEYNSDLFDASTIERLADHYQRLLNEVVKNPEQHVDHVAFLSETERHQLLREWNATAQRFPTQTCLHDLIADQVQRTPDAVALVSEDAQISYRTFDHQANQLAHFLQRMNVGPEVHVGLYMERSLEQMVALLAILKAGAAYVPLDPDYPANRVTSILHQANIPVLLTQQRFLPHLSTYKGQVLCLDADRSSIEQQPTVSPESSVQSENLAYTIYTSGSTGEPKGVMVSHRSLVNHCCAVARAYALTATDRVLYFASLSFDVAAEELFPSWASGAAVVLRPAEVAFSLAALQDLIAQQGLTVVNLPATYWHEWVAHLARSHTQLSPTLRQVIVGSERVLAERLLHWRRLVDSRIRLYNAYGPTEATITSLLYETGTAQDTLLQSLATVPIGHPVANVQVYLLDEQLQPVPVGVGGEVYIGGEGLARGYLQQPDLTAERFLPHPWSATPGARLYRTGDQARRLPDGTVVFLSRADRQIKLRGFRVEPGEIEAVLSQHPLIQEQVVLLREIPDAEKRLVAYVVPDQGRTQNVDWYTEQVSQWQILYEKIYSQLSLQLDPLLNFEGWDSTYTGKPIPEEEMREWAEHTAARILGLHPAHILEIGCGAGLLLFRLAPLCTSYHGTDFSSRAIHYLQARLQQSGQSLSHVRLDQREADDFTGFETGLYDVIILNSVIQYFPGIDYLLRVLENALRILRPGGHIFIGDVRNLHLLEAFHASLQIFQAQPSLSLEQLNRRVRQRMAQDPELVLDPTFFLALKQHFPQISHVQVQPKRGHAHNELTCFRYDVTLSVAPQGQAIKSLSWLDWVQHDLNLAGLRHILEETSATMIGFTGIPNARLRSEIRDLELLARHEQFMTVGDLKDAFPHIETDMSIEIEDLAVLASDTHFSLEMSWLYSGGDGSFDAVFRRINLTEGEAAGNVLFPGRADSRRPWNAYANNPLQGRLAERLVPDLQHFLEERLPTYMIPAAFALVESLPLLPSGKIDERALPEPEGLRPDLPSAYVPPRSQLERSIMQVWREILRIEKIGVHDNFFDLGGYSLLLVQVHSRLCTVLDTSISIIDLFHYPTINSLATYLSQESIEQQALKQSQKRAGTGQADADARRQQSGASERDPATSSGEIAIIGMAGRFPGADSVEQFWHNMSTGVEAIKFFTDEELLLAGIAPELVQDPSYVKAAGWLADVDLFDASFFGYSPREAEIMDPQHRVFLEIAWQALENAGYNPDTYAGPIGLYAGCGINTYLLFNVLPNHQIVASTGFYQTIIGNDPGLLATRTSYKLNLRGPSVNIDTACSTSLVAVHMACQSLLHRECDMALAGGSSIALPQVTGYLYMEGMINSPDGHCRAFDAQARGTIGGNGVALVVLKRLEDALRDGDNISAVIKGSAINNDGADKIGFTAPSIRGQATVITKALEMAQVDPRTITYVETHGTGTVLGDPIEIAALTQAYRQYTEAKGYCAIGSVKTSVGHLNVAAGVSGLINAALALKYSLIPPSLNFQQPNPKIDFANSPFYVNTAPSTWKATNGLRRAAVSSFGIGGTNAHAVLQEAPALASSPPSRPWRLLVLSARTPSARNTAMSNLAAFIEKHPDLDLADIAYTYQVGRKAFSHRCMLLCRNRDEALKLLKSADPERVFTSMHKGGDRPVVFLFPGGGTHYPGMARELYQTEPVFREQVDLCAELLSPYMGRDLRTVLYPQQEAMAAAGQLMNEMAIAQVAIFVTEYALAKLWMGWGIRPQTMIGHSLGEYVAACLADVFSLEDALAIVAARGRLLQQLPRGSMLSVSLPVKEVYPLLGTRLSLAAINAPSLCVVSGSTPEIEELQTQLTARGTPCQLLHIPHAAHSTMVETIMPSFAQQFSRVYLRPPTTPYISNVTGTWITVAEATSPDYWTRHLRQTVRFAQGIQELLQESDRLFLEVGPGRTLATLVRQQPDSATGRVVLSSLPHARDHQADSELILTTLGKLWLAGAVPQWDGLYTHEKRLRVPLPTYPFERQRHWLETPGGAGLFSKYRMYEARAEEKSEQMVGQDNNSTSTPMPMSPQLSTNLHIPLDKDASAATPLPDQADQNYVGPDNEIEHAILLIWQELLGIKQISIHDNFFELGGHSLMASLVIHRLREIFPVDIPLSSLFEAVTIAQLAEFIEGLLLEQLEALSDEEVRRLGLY
jgi:amino acid adenylation domain-containing protein